MFIRSSSKLRADIYGIQYTNQVCQTESNRSFEYAFIAFLLVRVTLKNSWQMKTDLNLY